MTTMTMSMTDNDDNDNNDDNADKSVDDNADNDNNNDEVNTMTQSGYCCLLNPILSVKFISVISLKERTVV